MRLVGRLIGWPLGLAIFFVALVWLIFRPNGEISVHLGQIDENLKPRASATFTNAQPIAHRMLEDWAFIVGLLDDPSASNIQLLKQKYEDHSNVSDAININLSFNITQQGWDYSVKFLAEPILNQLYVIFGMVDYELVFFTFDRRQELYQADVQLRPSDSPRRLIPGNGFGDEDAIARSIAEYIVSVAIRPSLVGQYWRELTKRCYHTICPEDLPTDSQALDHTRNGFYLMYLGGSHPDCRIGREGFSDECAVVKAKERFAMALKHDGTDYLALFGDGLASLKRAKQLIERDNRSEYEIGDELSHAIASLVAATKQNKSLIGKVGRKDFGNLLNQEEITALDIGPDFLKTAMHYLNAKSFLQPANYEKVIAEIGQIKNYPKYLHGHIKSIELTARLFGSKDLESAAPYLDELASKEIKKALGDWGWHYLNGYFICYWHAGSEERVDEALKLLELAKSDHLPLGIGAIEAQLQINTAQAYCLARSGRHENAESIVQNYFLPRVESSRIDLLSKVASMDSKKRFFMSSVFLGLGEIYAAMTKFDLATPALQRAVEAEGKWFEFISRSPIFLEYRRSEYFDRLRSLIFSHN